MDRNDSDILWTIIYESLDPEDKLSYFKIRPVDKIII